MNCKNKIDKLLLSFLLLIGLPLLTLAQADRVESLIKYASTLNHRAKYDSAILYCNAALQLDSQSAWAYLIKGNAYDDKEDYDQAIASYTKAIEISSNYSGAYFNRAIAYKHKGSYELSMADYTKAIALDPKNADAYSGRGVVYDLQGNYDKAISDYDKAIALDPRHSRAYNNRGDAYQSKDNYDRALADYNKAIELDPEYEDAYLNRGWNYYILDKYDLAIADYNMAISLDPDDEVAYNDRGLAYYQKNDYAKALPDYNKAIQLDPQYAYPYNNRGLIYYYQDNYDLAIADYNKAITLKPKYSNAYNNRGLAYHRQGKYDMAISDYTKATDINPQYFLAYYNRGLAYYYKDNYDQAIADYTKAVTIKPSDADSYNNRGLAYRYKGNYGLAISDYLATLKIKPLHENALLNILPCLIRENRFQDAAYYYDTYKVNKIDGYIENKEWSFYKAYLLAATTYVKNNLYQQALDQLKAAEAAYNSSIANKKDVNITSKVKYSDILALKGYVLEKLNQPEEARNNFNQALVLNLSQPDVRDGLQRLKNKYTAARSTQPAANVIRQAIDLPLLKNDPAAPNYYAILIAEQNYSDPAITILKKPVEDALEFRQILQANYTFPSSKIDTLFNRNREDILGTIIQKCNVLKENDNLLIFFSGHGTAEKDQFGNIKGYLIPCSAKKGNVFTYISFNDIVTALGKGNTGHILLVVDACFSGALTKELSADAPKDVQLAYNSPSRSVMASGNLEPVPDNSVFMKYLMKRMKENKEKFLLANDLFASFKAAVINNSNSLPQYSVIKDTGDEGGDFVFIKK